jgi:hypothetical protein
MFDESLLVSDAGTQKMIPLWAVTIGSPLKGFKLLAGRAGDPAKKKKVPRR